ncbi:hypothetical protein ACHAXT_012454 [Thalassiosira profunda]
MATASKAYAASFEAQGRAFRAIYYAIAWIQALTVPLFPLGTNDEPADEIGPSMHQVNRAFGVGDSLIQIPLLISSAIGLSRKKRWALICTAASGGIHLYWTTTVTFILKFMDKNDIDVWEARGSDGGMGIYCFLFRLRRSGPRISLSFPGYPDGCH